MITGFAFGFLLFIGAPIGIVLALSAAAYIFASNNQVLLGSYPIQMFGGVENYGLLAIPLFLILGEVMNGAGITTRLIGLARAFVGTVRGGLAYINILSNALMASILGSAAAQRARALAFRSAGHRPFSGCASARYSRMARLSQTTASPSHSNGTLPCEGARSPLSRCASHSSP